MQERTAELERANQMLRAEILERKRDGEALREAENSIRHCLTLWTKASV